MIWSGGGDTLPQGNANKILVSAERAKTQELPSVHLSIDMSEPRHQRQKVLRCMHSSLVMAYHSTRMARLRSQSHDMMI